MQLTTRSLSRNAMHSCIIGALSFVFILLSTLPAPAQDFYHWQDRFRYLPRQPESDPSLPSLPGDARAATGDPTVLVKELKCLIFVDHPSAVAKRDAGMTGIHVESVTGLGLIETPEFHQMCEAYVGQPVSVRRLNELVRECIIYYRNNDQPVVDVSVPEQDVTDGIVQVVVTEALGGQVLVQGTQWFNPQRLANQVYTSPGYRVYESEVLEDVRWLQRNPFRRVDLRLAPGADRGETDVVFDVTDQFPARIYAGYEDSGNRALGLERTLYGFNWYNALWRDDWLGYQFTTSSDFHSLEAHSGFYSTALLNRDVLSIYGTYAEFNSPLAGGALNNDGVTWQLLFRWSRDLCDWGCWEHGITAGFDFKNTNTTLDFGGVQVFASDADIAQFVLGYQARRSDGYSSSSLGVEAFFSPGSLGGANNSAAFQVIRPNATAHYFYTRGYFERRQWLGPLEAVARFTGQIAEGNLLPIEQLGLGGYNSIRGYDQYAAVGDSGYFVNLELWTDSYCVFGDDELRILAFYDFGDARNHTLLPGEDPSVDLSGVGVGLRWSMQPNMSLRAEYAWQTAQLGAIPTPRERFHLGVVISH